MLNYLVSSKARRALLTLLWVQREEGSVSDLARMAGMSFGAAHKELNAMEKAGLARCTRVGNATLFKAARNHPGARALRSLLSAEGKSTATDTDARAQQRRQLRSWLSAWGAPVAASAPAGTRPRLESVLVQGAALARSDASVARSLPVLVWNNRRRLNAALLLLEARRSGQKQTLGFFLELTGNLAGDQDLVDLARRLRDRRVRKERDFFPGDDDPCARELAEARTPDVARQWKFRMNMTLETFASTFRKFASHDPVHS